MIRMANMYLNDGNLENAYVLYIRYMTLFLEKIRQHPDFSSAPSEMKATNTNTLREILPKAEKIKLKLLEQYTKEYRLFTEEQVFISFFKFKDCFSVYMHAFDQKQYICYLYQILLYIYSKIFLI